MSLNITTAIPEYTPKGGDRHAPTSNSWEGNSSSGPSFSFAKAENEKHGVANDSSPHQIKAALSAVHGVVLTTPEPKQKKKPYNV